MADFDVVTYLASKGHIGRPASGNEVTYNCFFDCQEPEGSKKRKLYVNTVEGFYDCKVCGSTGGTYLLQKFFGDEPVKLAPGEDPHIKRKILDWAAEVGSVMLTNNDEMLLYLMNERGLSPETIIERKLGFVGKQWSLIGSLPETFSKEELASTGLVYRDGPRTGQDFFYHHLLIPYISRGHVLQIRGKVPGAKYFTGPGEPVRIYNLDSLEGAEDVLITEGEYDCMAVAQHLSTSPEDRVRKTAVIGLAGANGFKAEDVTYLANAKRVFIGLDPDDTGRREAIKIKELLGSRARIVSLPAELPKCDWTEYLLPIPADASSDWKRMHPHAGHTWRDVINLMGTSSGKRLFTMRESGYLYRTARDDRDLVLTGFHALDGIIGGVKPGQVMIVLAKTGTGKTIFLCNLAYNMRKHRVLLISLEMTREEVYERMRRIYLFYMPLASDDELEQAMSNILICDENRLGEKDLGTLVDEFEIETGHRPEVVMVDYLGYYARGQAGNGQYEKVTNAAMQLKAEAKAGRFVCISPAQVNRNAKEGQPITLDDARDSGAVEETADFLFSLWRPDDALTVQMTDGSTNVQQSGKVMLTILKSRHGGKDRSITLVMDLLTLAIVGIDTPNAKKVDAHNYLCWRGETWQDLRKTELRPVQQTIWRRDLE